MLGPMNLANGLMTSLAASMERLSAFETPASLLFGPTGGRQQGSTVGPGGK